MPVWEGLLFGMMLQLSVGPVCISVLQRSIACGFREALLMAAGVALTDAVYLAGAVGGLSLLLQIPAVKTIVLVGGAALLVWFGIGSLRARWEVATGDEAKRAKGSSFWHGVLITLTNPLTILFWSGVFGSLMASHAIADSLSLFGFATGCLLATLLFLALVAGLGSFAQKALRPSRIQALNKVAGLFLIGFALFLLREGLS